MVDYLCSVCRKQHHYLSDAELCQNACAQNVSWSPAEPPVGEQIAELKRENRKLANAIINHIDMFGVCKDATNDGSCFCSNDECTYCNLGRVIQGDSNGL